MTPKSLLRHELSVSALAEFSKGGFSTVIDEIDKFDAAKVRRVVLCSGKVYFDLLRARRGHTLDDVAMEAATREVMGRLNPNFRRFKEPVKKLSGGQRQSVAIARAIHFNANILIMDEPTAALGPQETQQVADLTLELKKQGIGIFLISHDIHDVFDLADRVAVMKNGRIVGTARVEDVSKDEVLGMIILGKCPPGAIPGPGALSS